MNLFKKYYSSSNLEHLVVKEIWFLFLMAFISETKMKIFELR